MLAASWFIGNEGLALVVGLVFAALLMMAWFLVGTGLRIRRDREVGARMRAAAHVPGAPPPSEKAAAGSPSSWIPPSVADVGRKVAAAGGFTDSLNQQLESAGWPLHAGEFVVLTVLSAFAGGILGAILLPNVIFFVLLAILAGTIPITLLRMALKRRVTKLHNQLPDVLTIMASSLRAGHSFLQALDTVAKEIPEPGAGEFNRAVAEIRLGRPIDDALNSMADRVGSEDFRWAVLAVNIQREVGGNLAEILDTVADTVRERDTIRREVDVLTTEGRISSFILIALPFAIALYMAVVNPTYIGLLFTTTLGKIMLSVAISLMILGIAWMRKIIKIDV